SDFGIYPATTKGGIKVISSNMFLDNANDPVLWRGPLIAGMVSKFWKEVIWEDVDYMFVDMPPGTGDVPLTVFQTIKVDGIIVVTTPQELVGMIVEKAVKMANMMEIPIIGVVENMSYVACPHCDEKIYLFGQSKLSSVASNFGLTNLAQLPIDPIIAQLVDKGEMENVTTTCVDEVIKNIIKK
ncbi:MAG: P-loop NTPase, partial [Clostridia bacterium]